MFNWFRKKSGRNSQAHLLLLSKFRGGDSPARFDGNENWETVLKEKPGDAIEQFLKDGVLEPADLMEYVDYKFKATQLKTMMKERGMKVSGRKAELVRSLVENDRESMLEITKDLNLYRTTAEGTEISEHYLKEEKAKKAAAERETLASLTNREYSKAVRVIVQYEQSQVFPRGLGIDWKNYNVESDIESLKAIFEKTPKILNGIKNDRLDELRLAAGMMQLWGTNRAHPWLSDNFETGIHLDGNAASLMLVFHANYLRDIGKYRRAGVETLEVMSVNDRHTCEQCRKLSGNKFIMGQLAELPYPECECESGCRCTTIANVFR